MQTCGRPASHHIPGPHLPHLAPCFTDRVEASGSIPSTSQSQTYSVPASRPFPPFVFQGLGAAVSWVSVHPALLVCAPAVIPSVSSVFSSSYPHTPTTQTCSSFSVSNKTDTLPSVLCPPLNTSGLLSPHSEPLTKSPAHLQHCTDPSSAPRQAAEITPADFARTTLTWGQMQ